MMSEYSSVSTVNQNEYKYTWIVNQIQIYKEEILGKFSFSSSDYDIKNLN